MAVKLHLVDLNPDLVRAWNAAFANFPEVEIRCSEMLSVARHCVVSPANSHGFMDGGIDLAYLRFFGPSIEHTVREAISRRPEGLLPVGAALLVETGHARIPYMIVAPTMEMPEAVPASHCSRAMRALLRLVDGHRELDGHIYCPGLATLTGRVAPEEAATHMARAYSEWQREHTASG